MHKNISQLYCKSAMPIRNVTLAFLGPNFFEGLRLRPISLASLMVNPALSACDRRTNRQMTAVVQRFMRSAGEIVPLRCLRNAVFLLL